MGAGVVAGLLEDLPARWRGGPAPLPTTTRYRVRVGRTARDVVVERDACRVERSNGQIPDVEIITNVDTWKEIDEGRLSGIEAFAQHRLAVRGSIEKSLHFEPQFQRPQAGGLEYALESVSTGKARISALFAGNPDSQPLVLLHGLGATKSSWLPIVPALAARYRVIAIDLPGFGASSKPLGAYNAAWFADHVITLLDRLGHERVLLAGNSMGGRISMELAMRAPDRVAAIACLCPAAAFSKRPLVWAARIARPEFGILAARLPRQRVYDGLKELFAAPSRVADDWYDAAVDDFLQVWRSPRARMAFFASLRHIYIDEPYGEAGFWGRLAAMEPPALYVYGRRDVLITSRFARKVRATVAQASVEVWNDCGHVPQIEHPDRVTKKLLDFYATADRKLAAG
ncbi:MAG TPA: alpha/beta fold hydrolase [Actinomycetota bacterium]|jgi:pimeloyl-ACP methyl ester carboxylesterase